MNKVNLFNSLNNILNCSIVLLKVDGWDGSLGGVKLKS